LLHRDPSLCCGEDVRILGGGQIAFSAFLKRVYRHYSDHAVQDTAAVLAYYFVFSLFPFLFFLATLTAYLPLGNSVQTLLDRIRPVLPAAALDIINEHLTSLVARPRPNFLTIGLLFTLYSASRGVDAVRKGLNLAYDVKETRPLWRTELAAFGATIAGALLVMFGIAALVAGGSAGYWVSRQLGFATVYVFAWQWLRWPVTAAAVMLAAALVYYTLPNVKQRFKYITPGSVVATLIWLLATWGFSEYAGHFGTYNVTYGSIGGVIVLMTWLFISGFIFLMGGEINAIIEHASPEGKAPGAHSEGEAAPPPEDRPSAMPIGAANSAAAAERAGAGETSSVAEPR
jgi:membrane protein